jgi:hypothetical protein
MIYRTALAALTASTVLGAALEVAHAQEKAQTEAVHRVRKGDSLELLAAEYYGDRKYVIVVMSVNGVTHERKLSRGEKLRIPIPRPIAAAPGDTWEALAEQYMGDARRGRFLAEFNGMAPETSITAGERLLIPYHMAFTASSETKLTALAATFLFDRRKAKLLRDYNFLDQQSIDKGDSIIIPIAVDVKPSKLPPLDAESRARRAKRAEMQDLATYALPRAHGAWRSGNYAAVRRDLTPIEIEYLETDVAVDVGLMLGSAHVAFGDLDSAQAAFQQVLERNPRYKLSAYRYSPKIRAVWKQAGGQVEGSN